MTTEGPMKIFTTVAIPISQSFLKYLHLSAWLDQRVTSLISNRSMCAFTSVEHFWRHISEETLSEGDRVRFKEAFLTEWIPRSPGGMWFDKSNRKHLDDQRKGHRQASLSIIGSTMSPVGVIRLPFGTSKEEYAALSLTTIDSWYCDLGIPLVVSSSVYDSFLTRRVRGNAVEGEVEAILCFGNLPLLKPELLSSLGSDINRDFLLSLTSRPGLPNVYLKIVSPLDVKLRSHNTHPLGFLWCIDREVRNEDVRYIYSESELKKDFKDVDPNVLYRFIACGEDLNDQYSVQATVVCFDKSLAYMIGKDGDVGHVSSEVLTEFDARRKYFRSSVPLTREAWKEKSTLRQIKRTFMDLQQFDGEWGQVCC